MDRFTRNYTIVLGLAGLAVLLWIFYEDPQIAALNDLLGNDVQVSAYPYHFRVVDVRNGVVTMSSPRSSEFPAYRALELLYPRLANRTPDDPEMLQAQQDLAEIQQRAKQIVTASGEVKSVRWQLDHDWLNWHGVQLRPHY